MPNAYATRLKESDFATYPPEARRLAVQNIGTLRTLPITFCAILLRQMISYDWQFPAEREELNGQLTSLRNAVGGDAASGSQGSRSTGAGEMNSIMQAFAQLPLSQELSEMPWASKPEPFVEKFTAYLWSQHAMDAFHRAAGRYGDQVSLLNKQPGAQGQDLPARLCVVLLGRGAAAKDTQLFRKLRRYGTLFNNVDTTSALESAREALKARAQARNTAYAHWEIGGEAPQPIAGVTTTSYQGVAPVRQRLLSAMNTARGSGNVGPEDLRSLMAGMRPEQFGTAATTEDEVLRHFELSLLTEGSGTQIFSTTFVQWGAREVLRRARPETLLVRYTPRQRERPMNDLLSGGSGEEQMDAEGSLVDGDMGAYYTWINLTRLPGAEKSRFIACHEGGTTAVAIAPGLATGTVSNQRCNLQRILRWTS